MQLNRGQKFQLGLGLAVLAGLALYAPLAVKESHGADFERYFHAGQVVWQGGDIYAAGADLEFKYLPVFAQLFAVVAGVARLLAGSGADAGTLLLYGAALWYVALCLSYLLSLGVAVSLAEPDRPRTAWLAGGAAVLLSIRFFVDNVRLGQVNMFVMLLAMGGCWLVARRREFWGGAAIAAGAALKFMPAALLGWLLWRRRWRAAGGFALGLVVCLLLLPALTWGWHGNLELLTRYVHNRHRMVTDLPSQQAAGQSLPSLANGLLRRVNVASIRRAEPIYINLIDRPRVAKIVAVLAVLLAVGLAAGLTRGPWGQPDGRLGREIGLLILLLLLISPEARRAHYVSVLLPAAVLAASAWRGPGFHLRPLVWLGAATLPLALSSSGLWGHGLINDYLNAYGVVLWGAILLFAGLAEGLRADRRMSISPPLA